jgi:class 3 adenylate cyclase
MPVLAVFGAPVAHEDDPERALNNALDMLARSARLSEQWSGRLGQQVSLHIGINSGPVVAGNLGNATTAAYAVTGDTVNTTARLLAAASGSILVSDATHALTKHRFAFEPARELALRGKAEPVADVAPRTSNCCWGRSAFTSMSRLTSDCSGGRGVMRPDAPKPTLPARTSSAAVPGQHPPYAW